MGQHRQTTAEVQQNLAELLDWQFAERNDQAVAQAITAGKASTWVYGLEEAGLLDGFFAFLDASGIKAHWQTLTIAGVRHLFVPVLAFVLLYGTRVLFGIESSNALPALLFSNVAAMTLIGFNAHQVADGLSTRGAKQRTAASEYTLMDPQTLTHAICKISAAALQDLFNGTIRALAAFGVFMAEVMVAVDGTRVVTPPTFQGRGKLSVTERQRNRQGVQVEIVKFLFGWRLIALLDLRTLIPLAIQIVQIQAHEAPYLVALVQQAQANLAPHSRISRLVIDRAYVDGASLYALHELGITFVVIAKSNMAVRAVALAEQAGTPIYERTETVRRGHGREATTEVWVSRVRMVADLRHWDAFRPPVEAGAAPALGAAPRPARRDRQLVAQPGAGTGWRARLPDQCHRQRPVGGGRRLRRPQLDRERLVPQQQAVLAADPLVPAEDRGGRAQPPDLCGHGVGRRHGLSLVGQGPGRARWWPRRITKSPKSFTRSLMRRPVRSTRARARTHAAAHASGQSHGATRHAAGQADRAGLEPRTTRRPRPAALAAALATREPRQSDRLRGSSLWHLPCQ